ncbi:MAG: hypothetical protein KAJ62_07360 [Desulfobacteraceae bacterium]|nr:hypothetical protein [Desulfobacteraceae bacterium]
MTKVKRIGAVFIALAVTLLSSCVVQHQYTFNKKSYTSSESALNAHRDYLVKIENELKPISSIPKGNAIIITPSKKTCEALGINRQGHPTEEMINYLGTYLEEDYAFFSKFLIKSNLFTSVNHVINDYPIQYAKNVKNNYSATIFLSMKSPSQTSWMIMVFPENEPKQIHIDQQAENGSQIVQSWIKSIKTCIGSN